MKRSILALIFLLAASAASAQERILPAGRQVVPVPALGAAVAEIARNAGQMAEGTIQGGGRWLRIAYRSDAPIAGFVVPFQGEAVYNPLDMLRFDLPAEGTTVDVDLSVSPSWSAAPKTYLLMFSAPAGGTPPEISGIEILPATAGDSVGAAAAHALETESFVVSTYHRLRGYRVLGHDVLPVAFALLLLAVGFVVLRTKADAAVPLFGLALVAHVLFGARVDLDLARLTASHLAEWTSAGTYGEAGDTYALARDITELPTDARVAVCFDSTDYFAKLLRYLALPITVTIGTGDPGATHVAVVRKIDWSYEAGRLRCGSIDAPATLLAEFPDGSRLFAL